MHATAAPERVRFEIEGMTCASCAARIEKKLNKLDGVEANVNHATEEAAVTFDPARIQLEQLIRTVETIGYGAALPRDAADVTQADEPGDALRAVRRRLAPAAILTAPLTLLALAPPLQFSGWEWVALGLATPVVLWAGWPFHRAAALNARHLAATMDTLISIGTLTAWAWSAIVIVAFSDEHTYFEVGAVTTTLVLLGRFLETGARRRSSAAIRALLELGAKEARVLRDRVEVLVPVDELRVGDRFVVPSRREGRDRRGRRGGHLGRRAVDADGRVRSRRRRAGRRGGRRHDQHAWPARRARDEGRGRDGARADRPPRCRGAGR